tara:strand:+ start:343 stop:732 length:390 start_codon:yes stop_codon:yes gene_type:complete
MPNSIRLIQSRIFPYKSKSRSKTSKKYSSLKKNIKDMGFTHNRSNKSLVKDFIKKYKNKDKIISRLLDINLLKNKSNTSKKYSSLKKDINNMGFDTKNLKKSLVKDILRKTKKNKNETINKLFQIEVLK